MYNFPALHVLQPLEAQANSVPDPVVNYELFDRTVNVRDGYSVPLGLRGTVIGINSGKFFVDCTFQWHLCDSSVMWLNGPE